MQDAGPLNDSASVQDVLTRVASFFKKDWVKQYLFKSTAESDLSVLTSKQQMRNAFSGRMRMTCHGPQNVISPFFLANLNSNYVFIPAFCIDNLSSSILLRENALIQHPLGLPQNLLQYVRMVRNEDTGDCLCVCLDNDASFVDVIVILWDSPEHRHRCFMRFKREAMVDAVLGDGPVDVARIAKSVVLFIHINEHRMCEKCNPFGFGVCGCEKPHPLQRPRFVLDGATSAQNMLSHTGSFCGRVLHTMYIDQVATRFDPLDTFGGMTGGNSPGVIPRLVSWGISSRMAKTVWGPSLFPGNSRLSLRDSPVSELEEFPDTELEQDFLGVEQEGDLQLGLSGDAQAPQTRTEPSFVSYEGHTGVTPVSKSTSRPTVNEGNIERNESRENGASARSTTANQALHDELMPPTVQVDSELMARTMLPGSSVDCPPPAGVVNSGPESRFESSVLPQGSSVTYPMGLAPSSSFKPLAAHVTQAHLKTSVPLSTVRDNKEAKLLQRKLRNRESAARSNLKKQIRRKELKAQIAEEVGKIEKLKEKLNALQEENKHLRSKVSRDTSVK